MTSLDLETAQKRARILTLIREFFSVRNFLEVDTPSLAPALIPEPEIANFGTVWELPWGPKKNLWLVPSPELYMKRLLSAGFPSIFHIGKCFRNAENHSPLHNPEFTMLEWYERDKSETDLITTVEDLVLFLGQSFPLPDYLVPPFNILSLRDAFILWAGVDWTACPTLEILANEAKKQAPVRDCARWEDLWHLLLIERVEPNLPRDRPLVLTDWPSIVPTLSEIRKGTSFARRWELMVNGVELVNASKEGKDVSQLNENYRKAAKNAGPISFRAPFDLEFPEVISKIGNVSGAAMGLDRLVMLLLQKKSLNEVIFFPFFDTLRNHE